MNRKETIKSAEKLGSIESNFDSTGTIDLTEVVIDNIYVSRKQQLEGIKDLVCLKLYYTIEEKLNLERQAFLRLLDLQQSKQELQDKYSFILDPQYFDQKFLKTIQ